jgi:guanyl-specific ribonuclease Sa
MKSIGRLPIFTCGLLAILTFTVTPPAISVPLLTRLPTTEIESVSIDSLPLEAKQTIQTIERGGSFPYRQDGAIFSNRERRLPIVKYSTYREYTVPTPGTRTRGARRLVTAPQRIYYYTGDHYRSFQRVVR